MAAIKPLL